MAETTGIAWTDATMNFWIGCTKIGVGCEACFAAELAQNRMGITFGAGEPRRRTSENYWKQPLRWNQAWEKWIRDRSERPFQLKTLDDPTLLGPAFKNGDPVPLWIFASSLADFFDNEIDPLWRTDAWRVIRDTPHLRWQIVTKRPGNVSKMLPSDWGDGSDYAHVGIIATVVNQVEWTRDVPKLQKLKREHGVKWIGLSVEPMLGPISNFEGIEDLDWVICGGESKQGKDHVPRYFRLIFARWLRDACAAANVPFFFKQMGDRPLDRSEDCSREIDLKFKTRAGTDPDEWPEEFRIQEMPRIYERTAA